ASSSCSSVCSRNGTTRKMPVLLITTSTPPQRSTALATSCSAVCGLLASPATIAVRSPRGSSSDWAASSTRRRRLFRTTLPPPAAAAVQDDARPLLEEPASGCLADPASAARDQCHLAFELHLRSLPDCCYRTMCVCTNTTKINVRTQIV